MPFVKVSTRGSFIETGKLHRDANSPWQFYAHARYIFCEPNKNACPTQTSQASCFKSSHFLKIFLFLERSFTSVCFCYKSTSSQFAEDRYECACILCRQLHRNHALDTLCWKESRCKSLIRLTACRPHDMLQREFKFDAGEIVM